MINLYLVRHGECEGEGLYIGRGSDLPLTEKGKDQIHLLSGFLKTQLFPGKIDSIFSSPMVRAVDSADIISRSVNLSVQGVQGIEEIDFGLWEGCSYGDLMKSYPLEFPLWIDNPITKRPPEGESLEDLNKRVLYATSFLKETSEDDSDKNIVIVSHRGPLIVILLDLLGLGLDKFWNYKIERGSISKLNIYPHFSELDFLNRKF